MQLDSRILVTGHNGLIGSAIVRLLRAQGYKKLLLPPRYGFNSVDMRKQGDVGWYFACTRPEYVFHCAARVGGLLANKTDPLGFFLDNMSIEMNVFSSSVEFNVKKLVFLGSSCAYPTTAPRPLHEDSLLTGPFEPAVEAYGLAKVAGIRLCEWYRKAKGVNFVSAIPCNVFGIHDRLDVSTSHVIPGLLCRMHEAINNNEPIKIWGDGSATRELLFADDLAEALLLVMDKYDGPEPINTGSSRDQSIRLIASECKEVTKYPWELEFDSSGVVGTPHKCMDNTKIHNLGWSPRTSLIEALKLTYADISQRLDNRPQI